MPPEDKAFARSLIEAAAWRTYLTENDLESTPQFELWLATNPRNQAAWERVQGSWGLIGQHEAAPEFLELRRIALTNAREAARGRWHGPADSAASPGLRLFLTRIAGRSSRAWVGAAAATMLMLIGLIAWYATSPDIYRTQTGERRVVTLADGSRVQLDSSTELRVSYSAHARDLSLSKGQARFDVAHDVERPFSVTAAGQKVIATGTSFNVDMLGSNLLVTLIEGRVVVLPGETSVDLDRMIGRITGSTATSPAGSAAPKGASKHPNAASGERVAARTNAKAEVVLDPGQQLAVSAGGGENVTAANIERATAWQNGRLVLDNEPLSSVIERMNRYSAQPLVLKDARAAALRISGVFSTSDIQGFVDTLTLYLPVDAERRNGAIIISHR